MIVIDKLKIAFEDVPKVGSTSLFNWLFQALTGKGFAESGFKNIHGFFNKGHDDGDRIRIRALPRDAAGQLSAEGYFVFCLIRDPVKRILSAYGNRVVYFGELSLGSVGGEASLEAGFNASPSLNGFVANLTAYQRAAPSIMHHTRPMVDFLGTDPSVYQRIYDIAEMPALESDLRRHWQRLAIPGIPPGLPKIPRMQTGGPKFSLGELGSDSLEHLLTLYATDYQTFPMLDPAQVRRDWQVAHSAQPAGRGGRPVNYRPVIADRLPDGVRYFWMAPEVPYESQAPAGCYRIAGVLLSDFARESQLFFEGTEGVSRVEWGLPSPKLAESEAHRAHAQAGLARFGKADAALDGVGEGRLLVRRRTEAPALLASFVPAS